MKKAFLLFFFFAISLIAKEPKYVKLHLDDRVIQYPIDSVENITIIKRLENNLMKIYLEDSTVRYYPVMSIDSLEFVVDSLNKRFIKISTFGFSNQIELMSIDSIVFSKLETKVSEHVITIDSAKSETIVSLDSTNIVFEGTSALGSQIEIGDIIASEPTKTAPYGFLRKVLTKKYEGGKIIIETENAKLTDVIKNGIISFSREFSPSDTVKFKLQNEGTLTEEGFIFNLEKYKIYPLGDSLTSLLLDYTIVLNPKIIFSLVIENGVVRQVLFVPSISTNLEMSLRLSIEKEFKFKKSLNKLLGIPAYPLPPVTIMLGPLPVVITSNISFEIGCEISGGGSENMGIRLQGYLNGGLEYNSGQFKTVEEHNEQFSLYPPEFYLGGNFKVIFGPQLNAQFYGQEDAFNASASFLPFNELEVDLYNKPLWKLYAGLEGVAGIKSSWFSMQKDVNLFQYKFLLDQAKDLISSIQPTEGKIGDTITILGNGFGNSRGSSYVGFKTGRSLLDLYIATIYPEWSDSEIKVVIPDGISPGKVKLIINIGGLFHNMADFTIIESQTPQITNITPSSAKVGDVVTISGEHFGVTKGTSFVTFNGVNAIEYPSWNDTEIKVKVPQGATTGNVYVTVNGKNSNNFYFTIISNNPIIASISPTSANVGDVITITGENFGATRESSYVSFNNLKATEYPSWSENQIKVKVPTGATSGKISVTVNGIKSNEKDITITNTPQIKTIYASKDAYVDFCRADDNYNGVNLKLGRYRGTLPGCIDKPSVRYIAICFTFDNSINPNNIIEAKLILTKKDGSDTLPAVKFHLFLADWREDTINANWVSRYENTNFTPFDSLQNVSGDINLVMTETVKNWISRPDKNFGFIVVYDGPTNTYLGNEFWDRENGTGDQKPRLVITLK